MLTFGDSLSPTYRDRPQSNHANTLNVPWQAVLDEPEVSSQSPRVITSTPNDAVHIVTTTQTENIEITTTPTIIPPTSSSATLPSLSIMPMSPKEFKKPIQQVLSANTEQPPNQKSVNPFTHLQHQMQKQSSSPFVFNFNSYTPTVAGTTGTRESSVKQQQQQQQQQIKSLSSNTPLLFEVILPLLLALESIISTCLLSTNSIPQLSVRQAIAFTLLIIVFIVRFTSIMVPTFKIPATVRLAIQGLIAISYLECRITATESPINSAVSLTAAQLNAIYLGVGVFVQLFPPTASDIAKRNYSNNSAHENDNNSTLKWASTFTISTSMLIQIAVAQEISNESVVYVIIGLAAIVVFSTIKWIDLATQHHSGQQESPNEQQRIDHAIAPMNQFHTPSMMMVMSPKFGGGSTDNTSLPVTTNQQHATFVAAPPRVQKQNSKDALKYKQTHASDEMINTEERPEQTRSTGVDYMLSLREESQAGMTEVISGRSIADTTTEGICSSRREMTAALRKKTRKNPEAQQDKQDIDGDDGEDEEEEEDNGEGYLDSDSDQKSNNASLFSGQTHSDNRASSAAAKKSKNGFTQQSQHQLQSQQRFRRNQVASSYALTSSSSSEMNYRTMVVQESILNNSSNGIIVVSCASEQVVYANKQSCRLLRSSLDDVLQNVLGLQNIMNYKDSISNLAELLEQFEFPDELSTLSTIKSLYTNFQTKQLMLCVVESEHEKLPNDVFAFLISSRIACVEVDYIRGGESKGILEKYAVFTIHEVPVWRNPLAIMSSSNRRVYAFIQRMVKDLTVDITELRNYFQNLQKERSIAKSGEEEKNLSPTADSTYSTNSSSSRQEPKHNPVIVVDINGCIGKTDCILEFIDDFTTSASLISGLFEVTRKAFNFNQLVNAVVDKVRKRTSPIQYAIHVNYEAHIPKMVMSDYKRIHRVLYNLLVYFIDTSEAADLTVKVVQQSSIKKSNHRRMLRISIICQKRNLNDIPIASNDTNKQSQQQQQQAHENDHSSDPQLCFSLSERKAIITNIGMLEDMHYGVLLSSSIISKLEPNNQGIVFESNQKQISFTFRLSL